MPIGIGSRVRVLEPFNYMFPDEYVIESLDPDTGVPLINGAGFDPVNLQEITE